jgi:hypothetical protein
MRECVQRLCRALLCSPPPSALSFIPDTGDGWALDYPTLSLHAVSRSFPEGMTPEASGSAADAEMAHPAGPGCVYCQTDDAAGDEEADEDDEDAMRELWLLPNSQSERECARHDRC